MIAYFLGKNHFFGNIYYNTLNKLNASKTLTSVLIDGGKKLNSIKINISPVEFQKIKNKRDSSINIGYLISSSQDYVNAHFENDTQNLGIKIRLKGDNLDHLMDEKWSYRIKLNNKDNFLGMNKFSIQSPNTRCFINEWFAFKVFEQEDILTVKYDFINVSINKGSEKIYAIEEAFTSSIFNNNNLKNSVLIKFSEDLMYQEKVHLKDYTKVKDRSWEISNIECFQMNTVLNNDSLKKLFLEAKTLLEKFRMQKLKTSDVFDVEKLAKYYALCNVLGAVHGLIWNNSRYYFNPSTKKLEPIAYDLNSGNINEKISTNNYQLNLDIECADGQIRFLDKLFSDTIFYKKYISFVNQYANSNIINEVYYKNKNMIDFYTNCLRIEYPNYTFSKNIYINNQKIISNLLKPIKTINAYLKSKSNNEILLTLGNIYPYKINVLYADFENKRYYCKTILDELKDNHDVKYENYTFLISKNDREIIQEKPIIYYKIFGIDKIFSNEIYPYELTLN
ncbi:MAG: hypothetical protein A2046_06485 [Bacteroidetes bacterium GWA2_30_7]|nr:MAG: hypothetical protein A2046_06485 [Bacteroidetes bacterium GWA2_30_7]